MGRHSGQEPSATRGQFISEPMISGLYPIGPVVAASVRARARAAERFAALQRDLALSRAREEAAAAAVAVAEPTPATGEAVAVVEPTPVTAEAASVVDSSERKNDKPERKRRGARTG